MPPAPVQHFTCTNRSSFLLQISRRFRETSDFRNWPSARDSCLFSSRMSSCDQEGEEKGGDDTSALAFGNTDLCHLLQTEKHYSFGTDSGNDTDCNTELETMLALWSYATNDVCAMFLFSFINRRRTYARRIQEGCGFFSQAEGLHYLYFRDVFCFLPCQLHLQFCNFSFQQVDHFLIVLLCTVSLSLHNLCHLQLAVQRPVLREEPQCFLEAVRSRHEYTTCCQPPKPP